MGVQGRGDPAYGEARNSGEENDAGLFAHGRGDNFEREARREAGGSGMGEISSKRSGLHPVPRQILSGFAHLCAQGFLQDQVHAHVRYRPENPERVFG